MTGKRSEYQTCAAHLAKALDELGRARSAIRNGDNVFDRELSLADEPIRTVLCRVRTLVKLDIPEWRERGDT